MFLSVPVRDRASPWFSHGEARARRGARGARTLHSCLEHRHDFSLHLFPLFVFVLGSRLRGRLFFAFWLFVSLVRFICFFTTFGGSLSPGRLSVCGSSLFRTSCRFVFVFCYAPGVVAICFVFSSQGAWDRGRRSSCPTLPKRGAHVCVCV